jgi:hypothetical protein
MSYKFIKLRYNYLIINCLENDTKLRDFLNY